MTEIERQFGWERERERVVIGERGRDDREGWEDQARSNARGVTHCKLKFRLLLGSVTSNHVQSVSGTDLF